VRSFLLITLILLFVATGKAQLLDTLREVFKHGYSIDARLESRNSFIDHQLINVNGVRLGLAFHRKLRLGFGVSWLKSDFKSTQLIRNASGVTDTLTNFLKFVYLCYYADFVFYKTKRWQLSVPIQAGTGYSWFQQQSSYSLRGKEPKYFLFLYEPGITAQFKIFQWLGLGFDVAYRFTLKNNKKIGESLNSPTYSPKILFWFDQLYYQLYPKSKLTKRFGPAEW